MTTKRKTLFKKGKRLNARQVICEVQWKNYIYYRHKPMHPKFIENWTIKTIINNADIGYFRQALRKEEEK